MKTVRVKDVYKLYGTASVSVPEDASLVSILAAFSKQPGLRGSFLVNSRRRCTGIITRSDLIRWARLHFFGEEGMKMIILREVYQYITATKAKELAKDDWRSVSVKEGDTLYTALDHMVKYGEDILPVVDSGGKILGDLTLSEVLLGAFEIEKERGSR
jgi:CBS domain-containing protein